MKYYDLSVVVPTLNEEKNIAKVLQDLKKHVKTTIVVDDGSTDNTFEIAKKHADIVIKHPINTGKGIALKTGFKAALELNQDIIITIDADGQHDTSDIPKLINELKTNDLDMVIGSREKRANTKNNIEGKRLNAREGTTDKKEVSTDRAKDKRENAKEKLAERKAERKEKLNEKAKKRIGAYVKRIIRRLNAAIDRIEKLSERVESRILKLEEKFKDRGLDLSETKRLLIVAEDEISNARESISSIEGAVDGVLSTDNPKESFSSIRELIKTSKDSVKSAHRALVEAIKSLKVSITNTSSSSDEEVDE